MRGVLAAPGAELAVFDLALDELPVLASVVITALADRALQTDQIVGIFDLSHWALIYYKGRKKAILEPLGGFEPPTYSLPSSCSTS